MRAPRPHGDKRVRRVSLRRRLIAWSFVPTAIILGAVALLTFSAYQEATTNLVRARDRELTRLSAGQLSTELAQYPSVLLDVARNPDLYGSDVAAQQAALVRSRNQLIIFDGGVVLLDAMGRVTATQPRRPDILGSDWSGKPYFRGMLRSRTPIYSDTLPDGVESASVVVIAVPVIGFGGELRGVLAGMFRLGPTGVSALYGSLTKVRLGERIYLVDSKGRVIYHSDGQLVGVDASGETAVQRVLRGEVSDLPTRDERGRAVLASFAPVPGTGWALVVEESQAALLAPTVPYRRFLLFLLLLGLVVPAVVVAVGVRRVTRPILELANEAQRVAGGEFGRPIEPKAAVGEEIEYLAQQFNSMSLQLQESYATLERKVADRTRELATLNAIAALVSESLELDDVLSAALGKTLQSLGLDVGAAFRVDPSGKALDLVVHEGLSERFAEFAQHLPVQLCLADQAVRSAHANGEPVFQRVSEYPEGPMRERLLEEGLHTVVGVPLMAKGKMVGALQLAAKRARRVTAEELSLLAGIGRQVGVAVENARLYENAEQAAAAAERGRLARELHDAVTQTLFSATLIADVLPRLWARRPEEGQRRLEELRQLTRGALAEMRALLLELRPSALVEAELGDLLKQLAEAFTGRSRVPVSLHVEPTCELPVEVKVGLYRIAQEALNNVAKHAGASEVLVRLRCVEGSLTKDGPNRVHLLVMDNGRGFDAAEVPSDHLGLAIMQERAQVIGAQLAVESEPGEGTQVTVLWPAQSVPPQSAAVGRAQPPL